MLEGTVLLKCSASEMIKPFCNNLGTQHYRLFHYIPFYLNIYIFLGGGWWKVLHLLNVPHCKKNPKPFCNKEHKIVTDSQDTTKFVSNCT